MSGQTNDEKVVETPESSNEKETQSTDEKELLETFQSSNEEETQSTTPKSSAVSISRCHKSSKADNDDRCKSHRPRSHLAMPAATSTPPSVDATKDGNEKVKGASTAAVDDASTAAVDDTSTATVDDDLGEPIEAGSRELDDKEEKQATTSSRKIADSDNDDDDEQSEEEKRELPDTALTTPRRSKPGLPRKIPVAVVEGDDEQSEGAIAPNDKEETQSTTSSQMIADSDSINNPVMPAAASTTPKRKRGRPRKIPVAVVEGEDSPAIEAPKRKRGRPRKHPISDNMAVVGPKRKRGRPRKEPIPDSPENPAIEAPKRKRGRPRKEPIPDNPAIEAPKRKRGRPKKHPKRKVGRPRKEPIPDNPAIETHKRKRGRPRKIAVIDCGVIVPDVDDLEKVEEDVNCDFSDNEETQLKASSKIPDSDGSDYEDPAIEAPKRKRGRPRKIAVIDCGVIVPDVNDLEKVEEDVNCDFSDSEETQLKASSKIPDPDGSDYEDEQGEQEQPPLP